MPDYVVKADLLGKSFPGAKRGDVNVVFEDVNFGLRRGEFVTCIGHSGCGKSTILNILAGLDSPSSGYVFVDGELIQGPGLDRAVVFQNHSLLPWLSALKNVALGVKSKWPDWNDEQVKAHALKYLELASLTTGLDRKPHALSGGMRQRVGIARAFALETELLLMDEPFGALDALTRGSIQDELIRIWTETKKTVFMITHDVDEAILLSDRVFLMTNGPKARIAEAVVIDIPRPRVRGEIIHQPGYYDIRNHIIDFLVKRSAELSGSARPVPVSEVQTQSQQLVYPPDVNPIAAARSAGNPARRSAQTGDAA